LNPFLFLETSEGELNLRRFRDRSADELGLAHEVPQQAWIDTKTTPILQLSDPDLCIIDRQRSELEQKLSSAALGAVDTAHRSTSTGKRALSSAATTPERTTDQGEEQSAADIDELAQLTERRIFQLQHLIQDNLYLGAPVDPWDRTSDRSSGWGVCTNVPVLRKRIMLLQNEILFEKYLRQVCSMGVFCASINIRISVFVYVYARCNIYIYGSRCVFVFVCFL
jgi:hypothetical protein